MSGEPPAVVRQDDDLLLTLKVQPRASKDELIWQGAQLKLRITAPPVEGKANAHLTAFLAKLFRVAKGQVEIVSGEGGRDKRVRVRAPREIPPQLAEALAGRGLATP